MSSKIKTDAPATEPTAGPVVEPVAPKATADTFIEKHSVGHRHGALMRSKLPKSHKGIDGFLDEFASSSGKRTTMRRELEEFTPVEG